MISANGQQGKHRDALLRMFSFSFFSTSALIVSFFPLYFLSKGYSATQIGLINSIGPMIGILANLFWGIVSDKYRSVKKVLIVILFGQLIAASIAFQSGTFGFLLVMMACFFFFQTPMTALSDSLTLLTISGTKKSYASFRVCGSIGFAFSALLFGKLLIKLGIHWTVEFTILTLVGSIVLAFFLFDAKDANVSKPDFSGIIPIIGSKHFLIFMGVVFTVSIAHRMNDNFLSLFMQQLGANETLISLAWSTSALSEIPTFFLLSKYGHRFKELPLLTLCSGMYAIRFLLMSLIDRPHWVIFIQLMHSVTFAIFFFTVIRYISRVIPDKYRATGQAVFAVTWSGLAGLTSGLVGGQLFKLFGPHSVYALGSALALVATIGFLALNIFRGNDPSDLPRTETATTKS